MGIGGAVYVVGLLVNILLHVGPRSVDPCAVVQTMFYIFEGDRYMMILGCEFLATIHGLVDVTHHQLWYMTDASPHL